MRSFSFVLKLIIDVRLRKRDLRVRETLGGSLMSISEVIKKLYKALRDIIAH